LWILSLYQSLALQLSKPASSGNTALSREQAMHTSKVPAALLFDKPVISPLQELS